MGSNDPEIRQAIKVQEKRFFYEKFPKELKAYLYAEYGEDPWPYGFEKDEIFNGILADAEAYFHGKLDVTLNPLLKAQEEIKYLRELHNDAMCENWDLQNYIAELHELLWANGLEGSRMLHDESGKHEGSYAEFNTLHPEELEAINAMSPEERIQSLNLCSVSQ